jgi:hypothetical protein
MTKYSEELIVRTVEYFREKHHHHLNDADAIKYLDSYADLYEALAGLTENKK